MASSASRFRPGVEALDARVVLSASPAVAATTAAVGPPLHPVPGSFPSADANRPFTPADLLPYS